MGLPRPALERPAAAPREAVELVLVQPCLRPWREPCASGVEGRLRGGFRTRPSASPTTPASRGRPAGVPLFLLNTEAPRGAMRPGSGSGRRAAASPLSVHAGTLPHGHPSLGTEVEGDVGNTGVRSRLPEWEAVPARRSCP